MIPQSIINSVFAVVADQANTVAIPDTVPVLTSQAKIVSEHWWAGFIMYLPLISLILCGICAAMKVKSKLPAWITVGSLACSFVLTLLLANSETAPERIVLFEWINVHWAGGSFISNLNAKSLYLSRLLISVFLS